MYLSEAANVSDNVRRIIDNGFHTQHPFKLSSAQLEDFISVYNEIAELPKDDFQLCWDTLRELTDSVDWCPGCHGKGLAYLKFLSFARGSHHYIEISKECADYATEHNRNFKYELFQRMNELRVGP